MFGSFSSKFGNRALTCDPSDFLRRSSFCLFNIQSSSFSVCSEWSWSNKSSSLDLSFCKKMSSSDWTCFLCIENIMAIFFTISFALSHHSETEEKFVFKWEKSTHFSWISLTKFGSLNSSTFRYHWPGPFSETSLKSKEIILWSFNGVSVKLCLNTLPDSLSDK